MGATDTGRMIFPVNSGQIETDFVDGTTYDYDSRNSAGIKGKAYHSVSVNPVLKATNLDTEVNSAGESLVSSAIFTEIRNSSHGLSISQDGAGTIGNRLLPTNTTLTSYAVNRDETHSFKVKIYDSTIDDDEINRKFLYSTTDYPASSEVGLNIENYDYFILLNPEITSVGENTIRPHFAKITRIVAFDEFGDGLEFTPQYPTTVPINTKIEIFKGPAKTDTNVIAVSYGLRGDDEANTPKYDDVSVVSRPTFYFYNDRLDEKNQLDYDTKYTLTSLRWYAYSHTLLITKATEHDAYDIGSISKYLQVNALANWNKLTEGQSIYNNANELLGNIESKFQTVDTPPKNRFYLDYARRDFDAITSGSVAHKIGKTVQNVVFRTESKFTQIIQNIGDFRLDAVLVDANKNTDDSDSNFDCVRWHKAFPNMHRHTSNLRTATASTLDGNLTGPSKYLTFEKSQMKNDEVPNILDSRLNNPRNRMTKLLTFTAMDNSGIQHLKIKNGEKLVVRNSIYNDSLNEMKAIVGRVDKVVVSGVHSFKISNLEKKEIDLRSFLGNNSIVLIDDYYYAISLVSAKSNANDTFQSFFIKAKRHRKVNTWTVTTEGENASNKTLYVSSYTSVVNFDFVSDTEVNIDQSNRLTIDNSTIEKENTKLYNSRFTVGRYNAHVNEIDYADKDNKYLKLKNNTRLFYQPTGRIFNYYTGDYVIHEELFVGEVEHTDSSMEGGLFTYKVVSRDNISRLLTKTINRNLAFADDIAYSSLTKLEMDNTYTNPGGSIVIGNTNTFQIVESGTNAAIESPHTILTTPAGKLIGTVKNIVYTSGGFGIDTVTLYNTPPVSAQGTHAYVKYYRPFHVDDPNRISGLKAFQSNKALTNRVNDFISISEKGLIFDRALDLEYDGSGNTSSDFTSTNLLNQSNIGGYLTTKSLGYDISSPTNISTDDSIFAFNIGNENGVSNTKIDITLLNSETLDIVKINEKREGLTKIEVAPVFPVVLGRIDSNSLDTRANTKIYMVNNNINSGGYLHRLQDTHSEIYGSDDIIRYWDLQRIDAGSIFGTHNSIYNNGTKTQKIQGYAIGYGTHADGTPYTPVVTPDNRPLAGSNTLDGWTHLSTFYGSSPLIKSYPYNSNRDIETDIMFSNFEQIDYRTNTYELFATGDIFPSSKLRWNNMSFHTNAFESFGIILESEASVTGTTNHEKYTGNSKQTEKTENMFENNNIHSSTINTSQIRRWGVMRLVEATFDWHFNPVDFESLKPVGEIPKVPYFDYVLMTKPVSDSGDIVVNSQGVITDADDMTVTQGDMFYDTEFIGDFTSEIIDDPVNTNGFIARRTAGADTWAANDIFDSVGAGQTFNNIVRFDGTSSRYGVESFRLHSSTIDIESLSTIPDNSSFKLNRLQGVYNIPFTNVYLLRPNINKTNLGYALLEGDIINNDGPFNPHNIILPLISEVKSNGATTPEGRTYSAFHHPDSWFNADTNFLHMSRVICGLMEKTFSANTNITFADKFGLGMDNISNASFSHIYDGCIGVFKDAKDAITGNTTSFSLVSSPLSIDTDIRYNTYLSELGSVTTEDQHTRNLMIQSYGSDYLGMLGTKSSAILMDRKPIIDTNALRVTTHAGSNGISGEAFSAQFIVKPVFDVVNGANGVVINGKEITFTLNRSSTHSWLSFMPNLTGYYLVSEDGTDNDIRTTVYPSHPKFISKIIEHEITIAPTASVTETHKLTVDTTMNTSTNGTKYRLMRISETTFDSTPDKIEFNVLHDTGLKYNTIAQNFRTGETETTDLVYQEAVYSMYLLLDIDATGTFLERRTNTSVNDGFTNNETIDTWITDGVLKLRKTLTVSTTRKRGNTETIEDGLSFTYNGKLSGNGVVSFGEIFDILLNRRPKLRDITKCHIGNTFTIGTQIEKEIQNIVTDAGLEYDPSRSFSERTGNIVNSVSSTTVTCLDSVENIDANDVLYNHDGHLVGIVSSTSGSDIVFTKLHYTPLQYDELIKLDKKTFVTSLNLDDLDLYSALNTMTIKRGLDYTLKDGVFITRNIEDINSLRKYSLSQIESHDKISELVSNKSMFDVYNAVKIFGDGIVYFMQRPISQTESTRELRYTDSSITTESEAQVKAMELLEIHSKDILKIHLKMRREGLELLEAGDILRMNFPSHGIVADDYIVFEIKNMLVGELDIVVGTFDKTIAERLIEISLEETKNTISQLKKDTMNIDSSLWLTDELKLKNIAVKYTITRPTENSNMGFDDLIGFTEEIGFEESTQTLAEYDSENWEQVAEAYVDDS